MQTVATENDIIISGCKEFDLVHTFECGQCFRWNKCADGTYEGVHKNKVLKIGKDGDNVVLYNTTQDDYENVWKSYFDLGRDYKKIQTTLSKNDVVLKNAINEGYGIRILLQDAFETIISFIISANNNIPRIKLIIERLCAMYGDKIKAYGKVFYTFPSAKTLSTLGREELAPIRAGFRDKYIIDAATKVACGEIDINKIYEMDYNAAKSELLKIKGVGEKVANCILLFAFSKQSAFPVDVWIRRIIEHYYFDDEKMGNIDEFVKQRFGEFAGYAQQYLFYYARESKLAK